MPKKVISNMPINNLGALKSVINCSVKFVNIICEDYSLRLRPFKILKQSDLVLTHSLLHFPSNNDIITLCNVPKIIMQEWNSYKHISSRSSRFNITGEIKTIIKFQLVLYLDIMSPPPSPPTKYNF